MDIQKAREKAKAFIEQHNQSAPLPEKYLYVPSEAYRDLGPVWYFDFHMVRKDGEPMGFEDAMGGAPGYIVSKLTGAVQVIGWGALHKLKKDLEQFKNLDKILKSTDNQFLDLTKLRAVTGLSPAVLLNLRNKYKDLDMRQVHNRLTVIMEIQTCYLFDVPDFGGLCGGGGDRRRANSPSTPSLFLTPTLHEKYFQK